MRSILLAAALTLGTLSCRIPYSDAPTYRPESLGGDPAQRDRTRPPDRSRCASVACARVHIGPSQPSAVHVAAQPGTSRAAPCTRGPDRETRRGTRTGTGAEGARRS